MAQLIEGYKREDLPSTPQIAFPVEVTEEYQRPGYSVNSPKINAIIRPINNAFFLLLRIGECTKPKFCKKGRVTKRATRTIQFAVNSIGFFRNNEILPRLSP